MTADLEKQLCAHTASPTISSPAIPGGKADRQLTTIHALTLRDTLRLSPFSRWAGMNDEVTPSVVSSLDKICPKQPTLVDQRLST